MEFTAGEAVHNRSLSVGKRQAKSVINLRSSGSDGPAIYPQGRLLKWSGCNRRARMARRP